MNDLNKLWISLGLTLVVNLATAQAVVDQSRASALPDAGANTFIGWSTNGATILQNYRVIRPFPTNNPALKTNQWYLKWYESTATSTNHVFVSFLPESLNQLVWTNFIAHTNSRDMSIWSQRTRPPGWPTMAPIVRWNTNGLIWGMKGLTALSPSWAGENNPGQIPITLLTRRHGYARGHSMGLEGFNMRNLGSNVWFLTADNSLVTMTIRREVVRTGAQGDYTIFLFDRDLPDPIQPIRVVEFAEVKARYILSAFGGGNCPIFKTEQGGQVSAEVPGFTVNTWKGGDSGSPNLLPLPGELVFFGGRSTSGPSPEMQADMDALSKMEGINPEAYQLQWVDLSKYPRY